MSEWNGEGIPPVGTVCGYGPEFGKVEKGVISCHIMLSDGSKAALIQYPLGGYDVSSFAHKFHPIQSEEQRQVAEIEAMIASYIGPSNKALAQEIYNAGFRKVEQ